MTSLLIVGWICLLVGFVLGCLWNGRAYERGYWDGKES